jgi:3-hydroxyisobutyrate dehydrogenase-like beta-hydroxyacid dehydrogenase
VGGDAEDLERVQPVLETIGNKIVHMGPAGSGNVIKLINNLMMFVNFIGVCEGVAISAKAGIDLQLLLDAVKASMGQSRVFERTLSLFLNSGQMGSTTDLAVKDMRLGVEIGSELGVPLEVSPLVRDLIVRFRDGGDRGQDEFTDMIPDLLLRSGVDV